LLGSRLRGRVLLTIAGGRVIHQDPVRVPVESGMVTGA
jgi:hypothetical protein